MSHALWSAEVGVLVSRFFLNAKRDHHTVWSSIQLRNIRVAKMRFQSSDFQLRVSNILSRIDPEVQADVAIDGQRVDFLMKWPSNGDKVTIAAVEVKNYRDPIEGHLINDLYSVFSPLIYSSKIQKLVIVSPHGFTSRSDRLAEGRPIELYSLEELEQLAASGLQARKGFPPLPRAEMPLKNIFVLMPFASDLKDIYELGIRRVAAELNLGAVRADDSKKNTQIIENIFKGIEDADFVIGVLTNHNPNVFYEVGYSHRAKRERTLLISKRGSRVPFDLQGWNLVLYSNIVDDLIPELKLRLEALLEQFP